MELTGRNMIVIDLETAHAADDCRNCGLERKTHLTEWHYCKHTKGKYTDVHRYARIGWDDHALLGLSIGCYYDYRDGRVHWFDAKTLPDTILALVERYPLIVSFNGQQFDGPLMLSLVQKQTTPDAFAPRDGAAPSALASDWQALWDDSYDLLQEIWCIDPDSCHVPCHVHGLNSLDAIARATLGKGKSGSGADAPRLWRQERYAEVINYCYNDILLTKALFERVCAGEPLTLEDGSHLWLPLPDLIIGDHHATQ